MITRAPIPIGTNTRRQARSFTLTISPATAAPHPTDTTGPSHKPPMRVTAAQDFSRRRELNIVKYSGVMA